jgi:hypothetical protein
MAEHKTWEAVLAELQALPSDPNTFFMITTNKGVEGVERRGRFLSHPEAIELVLYAIEKSKIKTIP